MQDFLIQLWGLLGDFFTSDWWSGLTAIVLAVTLRFVVKYTRATNRLAETTVAALQVEKDAFDLRQRPVVSIITQDPTGYFFRPRLENRSLVHALLRVKATVVIDGTTMQYPKDSAYGGTKPWQFQSGAITFGNMLFETFMKELKTNNVEAKLKPARVTFETWSINFHSDHAGLDDDNSKGPIVQYDWSPGEKLWIPEVSPTRP